MSRSPATLIALVWLELCGRASSLRLVEDNAEPFAAALGNQETGRGAGLLPAQLVAMQLDALTQQPAASWSTQVSQLLPWGGARGASGFMAATAPPPQPQVAWPQVAAAPASMLQLSEAPVANPSLDAVLADPTAYAALLGIISPTAAQPLPPAQVPLPSLFEPVVVDHAVGSSWGQAANDIAALEQLLSLAAGEAPILPSLPTPPPAVNTPVAAPPSQQDGQASKRGCGCEGKPEPIDTVNALFVPKPKPIPNVVASQAQRTAQASLQKAKREVDKTHQRVGLAWSKVKADRAAVSAASEAVHKAEAAAKAEKEAAAAAAAAAGAKQAAMDLAKRVAEENERAEEEDEIREAREASRREAEDEKYLEDMEDDAAEKKAQRDLQVRLQLRKAAEKHAADQRAAERLARKKALKAKAQAEKQAEFEKEQEDEAAREELERQTEHDLFHKKTAMKEKGRTYEQRLSAAMDSAKKALTQQFEAASLSDAAIEASAKAQAAAVEAAVKSGGVSTQVLCDAASNASTLSPTQLAAAASAPLMLQEAAFTTALEPNVSAAGLVKQSLIAQLPDRSSLQTMQMLQQDMAAAPAPPLQDAEGTGDDNSMQLEDATVGAVGAPTSSQETGQEGADTTVGTDSLIQIDSRRLRGFDK
eukprot:TRINITY_DN65509_c0_g1_i1.p1 TRINITY_DN65509_c0_g1~~TRINITY_DN65509_c0_g1_i1.p1  ORF type:complete len:647 (+),score=179.90 TRINITY_DN65509_c0_g1_i1:183-2123(+)